MAGIAAVVQGSYSFVLTWTLTQLLEVLIKRSRTGIPGIIQVVAQASVALFSVSFTLQWLAGTPHIIITIFPGWIIGSCYATAYTIGLHRYESR